LANNLSEVKGCRATFEAQKEKVKQEVKYLEYVVSNVLITEDSCQNSQVAALLYGLTMKHVLYQRTLFRKKIITVKLVAKI